MSFIKYAARRLLTELFGILDKLEQYELRQAQEHNASSSASVANNFDLLEPNGELQAAIDGASKGGAGLLRLRGVLATGQAAGGGYKSEPAGDERAGADAHAGVKHGAGGECASSGRREASAFVEGDDTKEAKLSLSGTQAKSSGGRKRYRLEDNGVEIGN